MRSNTGARQLPFLMLTALGLSACADVQPTTPELAQDGTLLARGGNGKGNGNGGGDGPHPGGGDGSFTDPFDDFSSDLWVATEHALGRGWFHPENVETSGGSLFLTSPAGTFDGGEIRSVETFGHGRFEARLKAAETPSSLTALFLYQGVFSSDEIDIEIVSEGGSWEIWFTTWVQGVETNHVELDAGDFPGGFDPFDEFHTYAIDFRGGSVSFYVDGKRKARFRRGVPGADMHLFASTWRPTWLTEVETTQDYSAEMDWISATPY